MSGPRHTRSLVPRPQLLRQYNAGLESAACMLEQNAADYRTRAGFSEAAENHRLRSHAYELESAAARIRALKDPT